MGVSRDCQFFLGTSYYLRTSNFVGTFIGSTGTKAHENIGNSGRGRSQGVPKIFRAPICRAHCAVIFAIAQLSCSPPFSSELDMGPNSLTQPDPTYFGTNSQLAKRPLYIYEQWTRPDLTVTQPNSTHG